jgi:aryl-alcohol dehydrogenase
MEARAAVLHDHNGPFEIEWVEIDSPGESEVLVRIAAVGICHTDLLFASGALGTSFPMILGHEGAGVVEAVGRAVSKVKVGDKVLLTFDSCGHCSQCEHHNPAYCHHFAALNFAGVRPDGSTPVHIGGVAVSACFFGQSSFSSLAIAHERNVVALPPDADLAKLAPLGCGIQTGVGGVLRSLKARPGSSLVVIGGGAVGLSAVMGGTLAQCGTIILIEPRAERRELALSLGAHHVIDPADGDTMAAVRALRAGGVDNVLDTSGNVGALTAAIGMLAPNGTLGMVGVPRALDAMLALPVAAAITYGFTVKGIIEGDSDPDSFLPELVAIHREGRLPFDRFVRFYPFEEINQAIADARSGACVKAVLRLDTGAN